MFRQRFSPYLESDNVMFTFIKVFIVCLLCYIGIDPTLKVYFSSIFYILLLFFSIYLSSDIVSLVII